MQIKSKRYATTFSISNQLIEDKAYLKSCIKHQSKLGSLPKNTLKIKLIKREIGYNADDFMRDRKSVHTIYQVFTFKRNK